MPNNSTSQAPTRSSSRIAARNNQRTSDLNQASTNNRDNTQQNNTINSNSPASGGNRTIIDSASITPLMSINLPRFLGPNTTSSPESIGSIPTPNYSSITVQEIRREFTRMPRQQPSLPTLQEDVNPDMAINSDGLSLRDYVSASVGAAQANIMRTIEQNLAVMIPQAIKNSLDSLRSYPQNNRPNNNFQTQDIPQPSSRNYQQQPPPQPQPYQSHQQQQPNNQHHFQHSRLLNDYHHKIITKIFHWVTNP